MKKSDIKIFAKTGINYIQLWRNKENMCSHLSDHLDPFLPPYACSPYLKKNPGAKGQHKAQDQSSLI